MKKKIYVIIFAIFIFNMIGCSPAEIGEIEEVSPYESQLYGSMQGYFKYYYSMDLWSYSEILKNLNYSDNDFLDSYKKDTSYVVGRIDAVLSYHENYLYMKNNGQDSLSSKIISEDLSGAISSYIDAKREHLETIKKYIIENEIEDVEDLLVDYNELSESVDSLNTHLSTINKMEEKYIESIYNTIDLIEELKMELTDINTTNDI